MAAALPLVRWTSLGKSFGRKTLFSGLAGEVASGGTFAVLGRNGAGKSTFLKIVAGLVRPTMGRVERFGAGTPAGTRDSGMDRRHGLGFASPELHLYDELSARENLEFFARLLGLDFDRAAVGSRLEAVGLGPADASKPSGLFSSGMKQRLRLAFALLARPPLLLLDEPGSNLDTDGVAVVRRIVEEQRTVGATLIATNDPGEAALADARIVLG